MLTNSAYRRQASAYGVLMLITAIWGSTFLITRQALTHTTPFTFLSIRFSIASLILALGFSSRVRRMNRTDLLCAIGTGVILFLTIALQTVGAPMVSASEAGFLMGLSIPLVPLVAVPVLRTVPARKALLGIVIAFCGLAVLSTGGRFKMVFHMGEALMIAAAVTTALHIVVVGKYAQRSDPTDLAVVQIFTTAGLSVLAMLISGEPRHLPGPSVWAAASGMAIFATAFALIAMARVQSRLCPARASLIYALEPVWAGGFGVLAGETLTRSAWGGCGLILTGILIGVNKPAAGTISGHTDISARDISI